MHFYFLLQDLNDREPTAVNDQHSCIVFAQGLAARNIPFCGNRNFLKYYDKEGYLIPQGDVSGDSILVSREPLLFKDVLFDFHRRGHKIMIFDTRDEWNRRELDVFLPITTWFFRSTCLLTNPHPNVFPFAFALSRRILDANQTLPAWSERAPVILYSHRVTNHSIRNYVKGFYESGQCPVQIEFFNDGFQAPIAGTEEHFHWCQSGRRHSLAYYRKLQSTQILDAHGGYMYPHGIAQVDSWKLWEGFAAGCLILAPDFKHYGIILPYELRPFVHYIPIRYDKLKESYDMLARLTDSQRQRIAEMGRAYVLEKYGPEGIADYILGKL
jgi:hypothetical protein